MNPSINNVKTECVADIHNITNMRIYDRNLPSQMLQPYIDVRPVMTKYSYLPIVDPRKELGVKMEQMPTYDPHTIFNPGNTQSPWSGFASNINVESELRNQIYALQKCSQSVYVPNSTSDLYMFNFIPENQTPVQFQAHGLLFSKDNFDSFNPNPDSNVVGTHLFMNPTRAQVKDIPNTGC